jgi:hypothetical protein
MTDVSPNSETRRDYGEDVVGAALTRDDLAADSQAAPASSHLRQLMAKRDFAIATAGLLLCVAFSLTTDTFLTEFNLTNMVRNVSLIGIVAVGMTFLLIVGEIDLSVGSVMGFLIIVIGVLVTRWAFDPWPAALLVILFGIATGVLTGLIRVLLNIPSFIVTLAMLTAYRSPFRLSRLCDRRKPQRSARLRHQHEPRQAHHLCDDRRARRVGCRASLRLPARCGAIFRRGL